MEHVSSPHYRAKFAEVAEMIRQNWLKLVGVAFLVLASLEYFSHHMFGCSSVALGLLTYGLWEYGRRMDEASESNDKALFEYYTCICIVLGVLWLGMVVLAVNTFPVEWKRISG